MSKLKYGEFSFPTPTARPTVGGYARGGTTSSAPKTKGQAKVAKVMGEFKRGDLHSGSSKGALVKNPKQAMAIAMSEKAAAGYKHGGSAHKGEKTAKLVGMKREPEAIVKKEIALLKKAGAPAKIIKHEERELTMKKGGKPKYQQGGMYPGGDDYDEKGFRRLSHEEAMKVSKNPKYDPKRSANAQYEDLYDQKGNRRLSPEEANKVSKHPKYDPNRSANAQYDELFVEKRKAGGKVGYADGGDVRQMVKENVRAKNVKPVKPRAPMTERERQMMEDARGQKMDRNQERGYREHYEREEAENRADRKSAQDALMYIPRKIGEGARSAYDYIMGKKEGGEVHSDVAMDKKVIGKAVHKHEAAMHPGKPMTKLKKGGGVQKYADGGLTNYIAAPGVPGGMPTGSAPTAPSAMSQIAQKYAAAPGASSGMPAGSAPTAPSQLSQLAQNYAAQRNTAAPAVAPGRNVGQVPTYAGARPMGNAPMAASPLSGIARSFAGNRQPGAMKKGGSVKKGVPVHNRNPKC